MSTQPHDTSTAAEYAAFIAEIRAEMGRQRLSQTGLAQRLGVSQPWINRRMQGHTDITMVEAGAIAHALGLTLLDMMQRADANGPVTDQCPESQVIDLAGFRASRAA